MLYKFSDVNNDIKPQDFCFPRIKMYIDTYSKWALISCTGIGMFLILIFVSSACLCRHPARKNQNEKKIYDYSFLYK